MKEKSNIRLSVIIPFFNVEKYIGCCLDSVYRQDIPESEYEVICVDDCSPDGSLSIVESYAIKHPNLKIVRNERNRKLGGARNAGVEVALGNYIWFVDSDDLIEDNVLGTLCSIAEHDNLDVLHFNYENYPEKTPLHQLQDTEVMTGAAMFFDERFIWYHDLVTAWRKLYKRSFLIDNHISFAEHIMWEDDDYSITVFAKAQAVRHINLTAYNYRNNPDSITRVEYNSSHIYHWVELCYRLERLRLSFKMERIDERFQMLIRNLIRFYFNKTFAVYKSFTKNERKESRIIIRKSLAQFKGYISKKNYFSFIFRQI